MKIVHKNDESVVEADSEMYDILRKVPRAKKVMNLTDSQKKWWVWFAVEFVKTKMVSELDLIHLQKAAFWMDARCQAYAAISEKGYVGGLVQNFKNGASNISAHVSIVEKSDKHLDEVSSHFGLSIKDRKKLNVDKPVDDSQLSLFEKIQQTLNG